MNTPIQTTLLEDILQSEINTGILQRFPTCTGSTRPYVTVNIRTGTAKLMVAIPSGNLANIEVSLRGINYIYQFLNRIEKDFPLLSSYLRGDYAPTEEYGKDIDWTKHAA